MLFRIHVTVCDCDMRLIGLVAPLTKKTYFLVSFVHDAFRRFHLPISTDLGSCQVQDVFRTRHPEISDRWMVDKTGLSHYLIVQRALLPDSQDSTSLIQLHDRVFSDSARFHLKEEGDDPFREFEATNGEGQTWIEWLKQDTLFPNTTTTTTFHPSPNLSQEDYIKEIQAFAERQWKTARYELMGVGVQSCVAQMKYDFETFYTTSLKQCLAQVTPTNPLNKAAFEIAWSRKRRDFQEELRQREEKTFRKVWREELMGAPFPS